MKVKKALYKTVSVFAAAILLLCMVPITMLPTLSDSGSTVSAEPPHPATVTLLDSEYGSASIEGTDEGSITIGSGETVTVNVTPNEGYFCDSLALWVKDGTADGESISVSGNTATFTVESDCSVIPVFNQNGSPGAAAFMPATVSGTASYENVEAYILKYADAEYAGSSDQLTRQDILTVSTTVVNGSIVPNATLDTLWSDKDGDGEAENFMAILSHTTYITPMFELDPEAEYYAVWVGANIEGGKLTDWDAARNNTYAQMKDGFIMDDETGILYVPKEYTHLNSQGKLDINSCRVQLVYTVPNAVPNASFDFISDAAHIKGSTANDGKASIPVAASETEITLAVDEKALKSVKSNTIDSVTVNGVEYLPEDNVWTYDSETGALRLTIAPAGIHCLTVKMSNTVLKAGERLIDRILSLFGAKVSAMETINPKTKDAWTFSKAPVAGKSVVVRANTENGGAPSDVKNLINSHRNDPAWNTAVAYTATYSEMDMVKQALGWESVNPSQITINGWGGGLTRAAVLYPQKVKLEGTDITMEIPIQTLLGLVCCHIGVSSDYSVVEQLNYNKQYAVKSSNGTAHIYIQSVNGSEAIIGVCLPTIAAQPNNGFFKIRYRVDEQFGKITLKATPHNKQILVLNR